MANTRKTKITYQNLAVAYLVNGVDSVAAMLTDHTAPVATLDRTLEHLGTQGASDLADLRALRDRIASSRSTGQRGAKSLADAGEKFYSVQQVGEGDLFIRLPVSLLVDRKGAQVRVAWDADGSRLVVSAD